MPFRIAIAILTLVMPLTMHALAWNSFLAEIIPVKGGEKRALIWRQINHGDKKTLTAGIHGIITCPLKDPIDPYSWAGPQDLGTKGEGLRVYEYTPGFGPEKFVEQPDPTRWPSERWGFGTDTSVDTLFQFKRGRRYYIFSNVDVEMTCTKGEQTSSSRVTTIVTITPPARPTTTPTVTPSVILTTPTVTPIPTPMVKPTITPPIPTPMVKPTITPPIPAPIFTPVVIPGTVIPLSSMRGIGGDFGGSFQESSGCGDGFLEESEECDDGNIRDFDGCSARCQLEIGICGDGVIQELLGEECEPLLHDAALPYRCTQQCKIASRSCGDGKRDPGEECDRGKENSDRPDAACRTTCKLSRCGDGLLDTDEECDDGNLFGGDGCNDVCRIAMPVAMMGGGAGFPMFPDLPEFPQMPSGIGGLPWPTGAPQAVDSVGRPIPLSPWTASMMTAPLHSPVGDTGPAILVVMAGGAAAGMAWIRRKRR
ncbi:DUF4215 domain-containing protein [Candidatus Peregrinibacteria bacterium]|nr:DUF4215 domain-containing protein [Candidatus Peregrinibacteria bacterium]